MSSGPRARCGLGLRRTLELLITGRRKEALRTCTESGSTNYLRRRLGAPMDPEGSREPARPRGNIFGRHPSGADYSARFFSSHSLEFFICWRFLCLTSPTAVTDAGRWRNSRTRGTPGGYICIYIKQWSS